MTIGETIKQLRLEKGLKQEELAQMANISRVSIGNYERGTRTPTTEIANSIAKALNVPVGILLGDEEIFFSQLIELTDGIEKGFSLNNEPIQQYEQKALNAFIESMQAARKREENIFMQWQEQTNQDKE